MQYVTYEGLIAFCALLVIVVDLMFRISESKNNKKK